MKFEPHDYQQYCIARLLDDPALWLMLDMGLGKTVITLSAIMALKYDRFAVNRALVIAPKKVAEATWSAEAAKWSHLQHLRVVEVLGSQAKRSRALHTPADVWVINRENVPWLVDYYRNDWPFDMVVLDESTSFKNHQAKRFKALKAVRPRISRIVELSGTPAPKGLIDLWAQMYLLDGGQRLGKSIGAYRERYFTPDQRSRTQVFSYKPKDGADNRIKELIGDICVSMRAEDYLDLPDMITQVVPVQLDAKAAKAYEQLERDLLLPVDEDCIDAGSAAVLTNKLLQLCNGAAYTEDRKVAEIHRCKVDAFLETVEALNGEHALVFYSYQHDRDRLLAALHKSGLRVRVYAGPQDAEAWNAGQVDILLAHPASCAYGLNLQQGGRHIIWFGLTWSLELYQQANKRLHRQGQRLPVIVHLLCARGYQDDRVLDVLEGRQDEQAGIIQALLARIKEVKSGRKCS